MAIEIWLTFNNGSRKILFPVNPPQITLKTSSKHKNVNVQKLGEILMLQAPELKGLSIESFFPPVNQASAPYVKLPENQELLPPDEYVKTILEWKDSIEPSRLIITSDNHSNDSYQSAIDLNMLVAIDSFDVTEKAGDVGTAHFKISFTEYKIIRSRTVDIKEDKNTGKKTATIKDAKRPAEKTKVKEHKVVKNDSLWAIGKKYSIDWKSIAKKNNIKEPYIIRPGQVIKL